MRLIHLSLALMLTGAASACVVEEGTTGGGHGGERSTTIASTTGGDGGQAGGGGDATSGTGGTGGTPSTSGSVTTSSSSGGGVENDASFTFTGQGATDIPPGSIYKQSTLNGIPPFSDGVTRIAITNSGASAVTIDHVELVPLEDARQGEWQVSQPGSTSYKAYSLDGETLDAGMAVELGLYFQPYASGDRSVRVIIHTTDGKTGWFDVHGRGRDNLVFSPQLSQDSTAEKVWIGNAKVKFRPGAAVTDGTDGMVISGNVGEMLDMYNNDLVFSRIKGDSSQAWAKVWNESYAQSFIDPNAETGGPADATASDGEYVYAAASRAVANGAPEFALILKIKAADGALSWARSLKNGAQDQGWRAATAYAIDATLPDRVVFVGYTGSPQYMLVTALKKSDGSVIYSRQLNVLGTANIPYTVRVAADGTGYVGGSSDGKAVLARLTGLDTNDPQLDWAEAMGTGTGTRVQSLDLTEDGDVIGALYTGGADRSFIGIRIKKDGSSAWAKTWGTGHGRYNNAWVARRNGTIAYFGGSIAVQAADTASGDGFVLGLDAATGNYKVGGMYYGGKTTTTIAYQAVKGLVFNGDDLVSLMDNTNGGNNWAHYWGFWYQPPTVKLELPLEGKDGSERLDDYAIAPNKAATATFTRVHQAQGTPGGAGYELQGQAVDASAIWKDVPSGVVDYVDAKGYDGQPVNHFFINKTKLTP